MAKLNLTVEKLEDVEEPLRGLYQEKDGKFVLDVDAPTPEEVAGLRKTIESQRKAERERRALAEKWAKLDKLEKTPDEIEEMLSEVEDLRQRIEKGHSKEDLEAIRKQAAESAAREAAKAIKKLETDFAGEKALREQIQSQYERSEVERSVMAAITEHKGRPKLLKATVLNYVKPKYEDGKLRLRVYDDNGDERTNAKGELMTPFELVAEMAQQDEFAAAFDGSGNTGGGAKPAAGGGQKPATHGVRSKKDLAGDKDKSHAIKFSEYIAKFPTPADGLKAYQELPD